ncbi:MAG: CpsD/CapB family tyrosine-protein kinase [Panacagrimonas sp.]
MTEKLGLPVLVESVRPEQKLAELLSNQEALELYRCIDNELFAMLGDAPRSLAVLSAEHGEGRSTLALVLGCFAAAYSSPQRALLVESVLGPGQLAARLALREGGEGFNSYNLGGGAWKGAVQVTPIEGLDLLPAGDWNWRHAKLSQNNYGRLLREACQDYQWVIVDTPAGGHNNDVMPMARMADASLLVVGYGGASREQVQPFVELLRHCGARLLGGVLNRREYPVPKFFDGGARR